MNLDHDFVLVWKFSEDQKKANGTLFSLNSGGDQKKRSSSKIERSFSPNSGEDQKEKKERKRSSSKIEHFFPLIYAQMYTHSNYWGDADVDHSQTIGEDTAKLLGGCIPPISPLFRHPWLWWSFCVLEVAFYSLI